MGPTEQKVDDYRRIRKKHTSVLGWGVPRERPGSIYRHVETLAAGDKGTGPRHFTANQHTTSRLPSKHSSIAISHLIEIECTILRTFYDHR